jgi:putative phosphoribosyl transferase
MCVTAGDGKMGDGLCRGTGRGSDEGAIVAAHVRERVVHARPAFADRSAAGHELVAFVRAGQDPGAVVLALPRGGVPVARPLADALCVRLVPAPVRKLPLPSSPEMGFGAVAIDGALVLNEAVVRAYGVDGATVESVAEETRREIERRARAYPGGWPLPELEGRAVWIVDDGLATGYTARAAVRMARHAGARRVTLAVPVSSAATLSDVAPEVDEVWVLVVQEARSFAVASFYEDFHDLSDAEVIGLLDGSAG